MYKWYIKNKDSILVGVLVLIIYNIFSWGIDSLKNISIPTNKILDGLFYVMNYTVDVSFSFSVFYLFLSLITAILSVIFFNKALVKYSINKRKLKILKANYGINDDTIDITQELNRLVNDNKLKTILSNEIAGDPKVGFKKIGKIKYQFNGKVFDKEITEGELIALP